MAATERRACFGLCTASPSQSRFPCWGRAELLVFLEKPLLVSRHCHRHQVRVCYPCLMQQHPEALSQSRCARQCPDKTLAGEGGRAAMGQQQGPQQTHIFQIFRQLHLAPGVSLAPMLLLENTSMF